jgi:sugar-specific transcriptional regulator TrmB
MSSLSLLGLSTGELAVYKATNEVGIVSASELSRLLHINRTTVYTYLESLKRSGLLIETTQNKKKYFQTISERGVKQIIHSRIEELQELEKALPVLLRSDKTAQKRRVKAGTQVYRGVSGMRALIEDVAKTEGDVLLLGSVKGLHHYLGVDIMEKIYTRVRRRHKGKDYLISDWATSTVKRFLEETGLFTEVRFLPPETEPKGVFVQFDNKLIIAQYFPEPFGCVFEESSLITMFRMSFQNLWKDLEGKNLPPSQS